MLILFSNFEGELSLKHSQKPIYRDGYRTAATSKMERFVIIVNGWKPLAIIIKRSILDVAEVLDPPLDLDKNNKYFLNLMLHLEIATQTCS